MTGVQILFYSFVAFVTIVIWAIFLWFVFSSYNKDDD